MIPANFNASSYDRTVIAFSGGKDSLACVLWAIDAGCPSIELWHHNVDAPGENFIDWPVTTAYCRAVAEALGLPIYFSGLTGGFKGALLKENAKKAPTWFELPGGGLGHAGGTRGNVSTRRRWPAQSASLTTRYCSSELKIDVMAMGINGQDRFKNSRTLVITGERAEESANRATYKTFEPHRTDCRHNPKYNKHVDHLRPIHGWLEPAVWATIQAHGIALHPGYYLGFGRLSCLGCIFASANQWATVRHMAPSMFDAIAALEDELNHTINSKRVKKEVVKISVREMADAGTVYPEVLANPGLVALAMSETYDQPVKVSPETWATPAGAGAGAERVGSL